MSHLSGRSLVSGFIVALSVQFTACNQPPSSGSEQTEVSLSSWSDGKARSAIIDFVQRVTDSTGPDYVPAAERVAVFDNDGTLWSEKPFYFQLAFAFDRLNALAPQHPEWARTQPFKAALEGDLGTVLAGGEHALLEIVMVTHTGMTAKEFEQVVNEWIRIARHPQNGRLYTHMVFQPMLELLAYLRAHDFKTFIVSGGGIEFMRPWAEEVYGIPPEQVIGSSVAVHYEMRPDGPVLVRLPEFDFLNDKEGKPVAIHRFIGRRPILAFGNSDGDLQMLQWTAAGPGPRLMGLVHHTDSTREWAYDRESAVGRLDRALTEALDQDWLVVDMARDWKSVYATD